MPSSTAPTTTTPAGPAAEVPAGAQGASAADRRRLGAFYTPAHAAAHMVAMLRPVPGPLSVLEPSGGDGAFVAELITSGFAHPSQIEVWDLDAATGPGLAALGVRFSHRDSLLEAPAPQGHSHIIGNPPYLNKQSSYVKANRARLGRLYRRIGANDTYAMFTRMAVDQLRDGGQLVFLVSDTFLTLGIHRKLREQLLAETTITSITLLPKGTFADAAVNTAIINLTKQPAPAGHETMIEDLRGEAPGTYDQPLTYRVPQAEFATNPGSVFAFDPAQRQVLTVMRTLPKLMSVLDGGLGMHTGDNIRFLGVIEHDGTTLVKPAAGQVTVPADQVDGQRWRPYHKRGGTNRWWGPAEHCVRWDAHSRSHYGIPATATAGTSPDGEVRDGFIVSGVASALTARTMTPGAMWESNKAFALFPKDPARYPVQFFVAILNSTWYATVARALNHTVSFQTRDLQALPLLPFTDDEVARLAALGTAAVTAVAAGQGEPELTVAAINQLVDRVAARAAGAEEELTTAA